MSNGNTKTIIASIIGVALFIVVVVSTSYAYYTANVKTENESNNADTFTAANISATFNGGATLNIDNMVPGDKFTKEITVTNTGSVPIKIKIGLKEVTNQFAALGTIAEGHNATEDIVYTIKEKNGSENIKDETPFPTQAGPISDEIQLPVGEGEKTYIIEVEFKNDPNNDQSREMEQKVSGKLYIEEA